MTWWGEEKKGEKIGGFPRVVEKEESFQFSFGFKTATRSWASFSRKEYTRIHPPSSPPFISLHFFLLFFSFFLLIFAHFSTPISAHDPKKDWKESRANVSRVPPGINFLLFWESPRKSRLRIQHSFSLFPLVRSNTRRSNVRFYSSWIAFLRAITFFGSVLNCYLKILFFHHDLMW